MSQDQQYSLPPTIKSLIGDSFSLQEQSEQLSSPSQRNIQSSNINQLYKSRDNLRQFAAKIGAQCNIPIRRDVIQHCSKIAINFNQILGFEKIQKMVKNRIQKMIKNKRIKKNWSEEDILIFVWAVSKYADAKGAYNVERDLNLKDWEAIADIIPGVEAETCMFKWLGLKKSNLSQNCWSEKQSALLEKIVTKFGQTDWSLIAQKLYYANNSIHKIYRCPKQCRQHWNCYLNPNLKKGPWSKEEDILLLSSVLQNNGQKKWAEIVKEFDGRTENALKNRYTLILDKQMKNLGNNKHYSEIDIIKQYLQRIYIDQFMNMENSPGSLDTVSQNKLRQLNSVIKNSQQASKVQLRTSSLRRRPSTKSQVQKFQEDEPDVSYCDIIMPNGQCGYTPRTSRKCSKKNQFQKNITQRKNPPRNSTFKAKRWNSTPHILDKEDHQFEQLSQKKPTCSFNQYPEPTNPPKNCQLNCQFGYKEENPIYEEESDLHGVNAHNNYDDQQCSLINIYNNNSHLDKIPLFSPHKNIYSHGNIFSSFDDHHAQNSFQRNNRNDSPLSFHSFEQFVMNYEYQFQSPNNFMGVQEQNPEKGTKPDSNDDKQGQLFQQ